MAEKIEFVDRPKAGASISKWASFLVALEQTAENGKAIKLPIKLALVLQSNYSQHFKRKDLRLCRKKLSDDQGYVGWCENRKGTKK